MKKRYIDTKFPKQDSNITVSVKNDTKIFATYIFPMIITLVAGYLVYLNNQSIKLFEERINKKQKEQVILNKSTKKIIGKLSELNSYIKFDLENEILHNIRTLSSLPNINPRTLQKFKEKYRQTLRSIDEESISLPEDLYNQTRLSVATIESLLTLHLILIYDESFFEEFEIGFTSDKVKVKIGDKNKKKIHKIVEGFHSNFKINFEHLQSIYRKKLNSE